VLQEERSRGEHNLSNIAKTHERMQQEQKSKLVWIGKLLKEGDYNFF